MRVKLGDVCEKKIDAIKANYKGMIDYIDIASVDNQQKIITDTKQMTIENAPSRAKQLVFPGDILVSMVRLNLNAVALVPKISNNVLVASTGYCVLRCLPCVDTKYVFYFCQSSAFVDELVRQATGASYPAVTANIVRDCFIPLPSLDAQRHIAAILDKVTDLIAKRQAQLDKLDELVKSRFVEMFGDPKRNNKNWNVVPMSTICSVGSSKRIYQNEQSSYGIPFLRISDLMHLINTGTITTDLYIPEDKYGELQANGQVPKCGDILVTSRGTLGQCYIIKENDKFYFQDGMISWLFKLKSNITPLYLSHLFSIPGFQRQIAAMQAGSTVAYLSIEMIKRLKVMVPDIKLQQDFSEFVKETETQRIIYRQALDKLKALRGSLMQQFFNEELP